MDFLRKLIFLAGFLTVIHPTWAQTEDPLKFRSDGSFKIVQFTDCHYKWGKSASDDCVKLINEVLDTECPDLVVFSGDNVYSEGAMMAIKALAAPLVNHQTKFVMLFGNHDEQFDLRLDEQYDLFRAFPYNIQPNRPTEVKSPDFSLPILSSSGSKVSQVLYCFDSHSAYHPRSISRYAWINSDQIQWYRNESKSYRENNGGVPVPALVFLHIPLPEYAEAYAKLSDSKKESKTIKGSMEEDCCCPQLNSGLFTSLHEMGDVRGVFCGHDHDNDFALVWKNIMLAYGRYSGGNTVYNHLGKNGARVIELRENNKMFTTWVRLRGGEIIDKCIYPTDFPVTPTDD